MAWSKWKGVLAAPVLAAGLAWAQSPSQPPAAHGPERIMVVHDNGKSLRCRVRETWRLPDGRVAHLVQAIESGELITLVDEAAPNSQQLQELRQNPKAMAKRSFHWGLGKNSSPEGAPVPPHMALDSAAVAPSPFKGPGGIEIINGPEAVKPAAPPITQTTATSDLPRSPATRPQQAQPAAEGASKGAVTPNPAPTNGGQKFVFPANTQSATPAPVPALIAPGSQPKSVDITDPRCCNVCEPIPPQRVGQKLANRLFPKTNRVQSDGTIIVNEPGEVIVENGQPRWKLGDRLSGPGQIRTTEVIGLPAGARIEGGTIILPPDHVVLDSKHTQVSPLGTIVHAEAGHHAPQGGGILANRAGQPQPDIKAVVLDKPARPPSSEHAVIPPSKAVPTPAQSAAQSDGKWPMGAQSVLAAKSGLNGPVQLVPMPIVTVPQPHRAPTPPAPNVPEAPQLNAFVNAFSPPPTPQGAQVLNQGPQQHPGMMAQMPPYQMQQAMMQQAMLQQALQRQSALNYQVHYNGPMPPLNPFAAPQQQAMSPAAYFQMQQQQQMMAQQAMHQQMLQQQAQAHHHLMVQQSQQSQLATQHQANPVEQIQHVVKTLQDSPYPAQREWAAHTLANLDWRAHPQVLTAILKSATSDQAPTVRAGCVYCLGRMNAQAEPVVQTLHQLRNDADPRVRQEVDQALARIAPGKAQ